MDKKIPPPGLEPGISRALLSAHHSTQIAYGQAVI